MNPTDTNALAEQIMKQVMPAIAILIVAGVVAVFLSLATKDKQKRTRKSRSNSKKQDGLVPA